MTSTTEQEIASDIVTRLRAEGENAMRQHLSLGMHKLCAEAADEIARLRSYLGSGGENKLQVEFTEMRSLAEVRTTQRDAAEAQVRELSAALRPFAEMARKADLHGALGIRVESLRNLNADQWGLANLKAFARAAELIPEDKT